MTDALAKDIERAHEKLREIDGSIYQLGGRPNMGAGGGDRMGGGIKRRISSDNQWNNNGNDRDGDRMGRRITVTSDNYGYVGKRHVEISNSSDRFNKRSRMDDDYDDDVFDARPKRSLQSTVVMPSIETKSRDDKIEELNKKEKKEVTTRNRRMFSNLLMGTLSSFQKNEKKIQATEKKQNEKLEEIEKKLDEKKREEKDKALGERRALIEKRREQEKELRALTRKRALIQYAEAKQDHYRLLQNSIQTQTKPTLFFVPAKHTLRSLELLKNSQKAIQGLIDLRQKELERDLAANVGDADEHSDGETEQVKSIVVKESQRSREEAREHEMEEDADTKQKDDDVTQAEEEDEENKEREEED